MAVYRPEYGACARGQGCQWGNGLDGVAGVIYTFSDFLPNVLLLTVECPLSAFISIQRGSVHFEALPSHTENCPASLRGGYLKYVSLLLISLLA